MQSRWRLAFVGCLCLVVACGFQEQHPPAPPAISVTATAASVRLGDGPVAFTASALNFSSPPTSFQWLVNGVAGGNEQLGTIDALGRYTSPAPGPVVLAQTNSTVSITAVASAVTSPPFTLSLLNPVPNVTSATVSGRCVSGKPNEIEVVGTNFVSGATIFVDNVAATTTYVSTIKLKAAVTPANPGTVAVSVHNPEPGGVAASSPASLAVYAVPVISVTAPVSSARLGDPAIQFTATVSNLQQSWQPASYAWAVNGVEGGSFQLGKIDATGLYTPPVIGGQHIGNTSIPADQGAMTLTNDNHVLAITASAEGSTSASYSFSLLNPVPVVTQLNTSPPSASAPLIAGNARILNVGGYNFAPGAVVLLNGLAVPTVSTFNGNILDATVASAPGGDLPITVQNPDPGSASSNTTVAVHVDAGAATLSGTVPSSQGTPWIEAYAVDPTNGASSIQLIATTLTNSDGTFQIHLPVLAPQSPVRLAAASYLKLLINDGSVDVSGLAFNQVASMVDAHAVVRLTHHFDPDLVTAHANAKPVFMDHFSLQGDPEYTAASSDQEAIASNPDGFKMGLVSGAIHRCLGQVSTNNWFMSSLSWISQDASDGLFDGLYYTHLTGTKGRVGYWCNLGVGDCSKWLPKSAGTVDFLHCVNGFVADPSSEIANIPNVASLVSPFIREMATAIVRSGATPPNMETILTNGTSNAVAQVAFPTFHYERWLAVASGTGGIWVADVTDPNDTLGARLWGLVNRTLWSGTPQFDMPGLISVFGTSSHRQILLFGYGSKHITIINFEKLAANPTCDNPIMTPVGPMGCDYSAFFDFAGDLDIHSSVAGPGGVPIYIAGGIADPGRRGVWLVTADGYQFFSLETNTVTQTYPLDSAVPQAMPENVGGFIADDKIFGANTLGVQLIDLAAQLSYDLDPAWLAATTGSVPNSTAFTNAGQSCIDPVLNVAVVVPKQSSTIGLMDLNSLSYSVGAGGSPNLFAPSSANGSAIVDLGQSVSACSIDTTNHLVLFASDQGAGPVVVAQIADPGQYATGWPGLSDWVAYDMRNSAAVTPPAFSPSIMDPHPVSVADGFGYIVDPLGTRVFQVNMQKFLAMARAADGHTAAADPATVYDQSRLLWRVVSW